jgi:hypothetical protein
MRYCTDESGSTLPVFVMTLAAVVSLVGAAIALGMDSRSAGNLQVSADTAAISGATAFITGHSPKAQDRLDEAQRVATAMATENADYALTTLSVGAVTEDPYGQHTRIDIELKFEPVNSMAKVAGRSSNVEISRTAAAIATWGFPLCILGLNRNDTGLSTEGNVEVVAENCVLWTNSRANNSMRLAGGDVTTNGLCAAGRAPVTGGTQANPRPVEHCDAIPDPLEDWVPPAPGSPSATPGEIEMMSPSDLEVLNEALIDALGPMVGGGDNAEDMMGQVGPGGLLEAVRTIEAGGGGGGGAGGLQGGLVGPGGYVLSLAEVAQLLGLVDNVDPELYADDNYATAATLTLAPGTYEGLDIHRGHIRMQPGVYHIVDAPLVVRRRATLTGEGVTIILHGPKATMNVLDEARLNLTAPEEGVTAGFALAEDRYESTGSNERLRSRLTGKGRVSAIGTVYLPRQLLSITGEGAGEQASPLLQIVADAVELNDQGQLKIEFDTTQTDVPVKIKPQRTARLIQ